MQTRATHPKTARREEKSDKKKEERIGAQLMAEITDPPNQAALQSFQTLYGDLQAHIYNRRGHRSRSANAVATVAAITRALSQSMLRRSCN